MPPSPAPLAPRGLSGVGDLVATCYSEHSRNNRVGKLLGQGQSLEEIIASTRMIAEGVPKEVMLRSDVHQIYVGIES